MSTLHQEVNGQNINLPSSKVYGTSDSIFWAAMLSKGIYPFKISLTEQAIQVSYELEKVAGFITEVSSGKTEINELDAHGSTVLWKAVIGVMKMLSRYEIDRNLAGVGSGEPHAYTTDQYLVWVLSFRGITPSRIISRGNDAAFEFDSIDELKDFLFFPFTGNLHDYASMRGVWKQAKNFRKNRNE